MPRSRRSSSFSSSSLSSSDIEAPRIRRPRSEKRRRRHSTTRKREEEEKDERALRSLKKGRRSGKRYDGGQTSSSGSSLGSWPSGSSGGSDTVRLEASPLLSSKTDPLSLQDSSGSDSSDDDSSPRRQKKRPLAVHLLIGLVGCIVLLGGILLYRNLSSDSTSSSSSSSSSGGDSASTAATTKASTAKASKTSSATQKDDDSSTAKTSSADKAGSSATKTSSADDSASTSDASSASSSTETFPGISKNGIGIGFLPECVSSTCLLISFPLWSRRVIHYGKHPRSLSHTETLSSRSQQRQWSSNVGHHERAEHQKFILRMVRLFPLPLSTSVLHPSLILQPPPVGTLSYQAPATGTVPNSSTKWTKSLPVTASSNPLSCLRTAGTALPRTTIIKRWRLRA
jgi:hypothetical protein